MMEDSRPLKMSSTEGRGPTEKTQVVVIGGGHAGSTAAAVLALAGIRCILLEKERFPRFHIGESLMTETYWVLRKIGVLGRLEASEFPRKYSVQFFSASGKPSKPFYFRDHNPHESAVTWQVERAEFDRMLLENAASRGVDVRTGAKVERVLFDGRETSPRASGPTAGPAEGRATGVRGSYDDGREFQISCNVVVDASGLSSILARQLGIARKDPKLDKAAVYAHFEGAHRDPGIDEGATLVISTKEHRGWFWYIPLSRDRVSVGVVASARDLLKDRGPPEKVLETEISECAAVRERVAKARRVSPVRVTGDYTWRSRRCAGDGYVLIGDAFGFIDPIYSSGVLLALKSGELAAEAIAQAFKAEDLSASRLACYGYPLVEGMEALRKLVYAYYTPGFSFAEFVTQHPEHRPKLVQLLMGDVFRAPVREIFDAMGAMCDLPGEIPLESIGAGAASGGAASGGSP
jgi:flavin-dependent dehydrogenase